MLKKKEQSEAKNAPFKTASDEGTKRKTSCLFEKEIRKGTKKRKEDDLPSEQTGFEGHFNSFTSQPTPSCSSLLLLAFPPFPFPFLRFVPPLSFRTHPPRPPHSHHQLSIPFLSFTTGSIYLLCFMVVTRDTSHEERSPLKLDAPLNTLLRKNKGRKTTVREKDIFFAVKWHRPPCMHK